ncbi:hypothetical protein B9G55_22400 [Saccharibacillus sp. O16]|nr:hypothetical protein B9G55_22400 [Saccharibacillus sp. O16]
MVRTEALRGEGSEVAVSLSPKGDLRLLRPCASFARPRREISPSPRLEEGKGFCSPNTGERKNVKEIAVKKAKFLQGAFVFY